MREHQRIGPRKKNERKKQNERKKRKKKNERSTEKKRAKHRKKKEKEKRRIQKGASCSFFVRGSFFSLAATRSEKGDDTDE